MSVGLICGGQQLLWSYGAVGSTYTNTGATPEEACSSLVGTVTTFALGDAYPIGWLSGTDKPTTYRCVYPRPAGPLNLTIGIYYFNSPTSSWVAGYPPGTNGDESCTCLCASCGCGAYSPGTGTTATGGTNFSGFMSNGGSSGGGYPGNMSFTPHPIATGSGEEVQDVLDWASPREFRFAFARHYSSSETYSLSISDFGYGMAWWSPWEKRIYQLNSNKFYYYDDRNNWFFFTSTTTSGPITASSANHPYSMAREASGNASRLILSDGRGMLEYYSRTSTSGSTTALLNEIKWADGYDIQITRDSSNRIASLTDNRGQRAEFTWSVWTVNSTTGQQVSVVSQVAIDVDYNGTTLNPDVIVAYGYALASTLKENVLLTSATVTDVAASSTIRSATYDYDTAMSSGKLPTRPAKLTAIYDGRLDGSGSPFPYENIQYTPDLTTGGLMRANQGGLAGFTLDTYQVNQQSSTQVQVINPLGKEADLTFATVANRKVLTQANGVATSSVLATTASLGYTPNSGAPAGYVYQRVDRNGSVTNYTRDARGLLLTAVEDATGTSPRTTTYTWSSSLRLPLTRVSDGLTETFTYTGDGLLTSYSQTDTKSGSPTYNQTRTWTYSYTTLASGLKVVTSVDGPGLASNGIVDVTSYTYTAKGDLATVTDPNGLVTTVLSRNDQGQPTQIEQPDKYVWTFTYDRMGRVLTSAFNPPGQTPAPASFGYDVVGQLTSYTDSLSQTWSFDYDEARRLVKTVAPSGDTASFTHDAAGNITQTEYSNGTGPVSFWEQTQFDELGRLLKTIGAEGQQWDFTHDVEDNPGTETDPLSYVNTFGFDALSRLTSVVDRESFTTAMTYDAHDRETTFTDPRSIVTTFTYDGFGAVVTETSADRGTTSYSHLTSADL